MDTSKITEIAELCAELLETADEERIIGRVMILSKSIQQDEDETAMLELACLMFLRNQDA